MHSKARKLLDEVEAGALNGDMPLSAVLRKCVIFGSYVKVPELAAWARRELDGYPTEEVPHYRRLASQLYVFTWGQGVGQGPPVPIPSSSWPEQLQTLISDQRTMRDGVANIEAALTSQNGELVFYQYTGGDLLLKMLKPPPMVKYVRIAEAVPVSGLKNILEEVRNKLVVMIGDVVQTLPDDDATPSKEAVAQAFQLTIGDNAKNIVVNTNQAQGGSTITTAAEPAAEKAGFWTRSRKIGVFVVTLIAATAGLVQILSDGPDALDTINPPGVSSTPAASPSP